MSTSATYVAREKRFRELLKRKPGPGEELHTKDGNPVPVYVEYDALNGKSDSRKRMMFTNAIIDRECTGWYLSSDLTGLKVLIMPRSQEVLIEGNDGNLENLTVSVLRVVRHSTKGTALIAETID